MTIAVTIENTDKARALDWLVESWWSRKELMAFVADRLRKQKVTT